MVREEAVMLTIEVRRPKGTIIQQWQWPSSSHLELRGGYFGGSGPNERIIGEAEVWFQKGPNAEWKLIAKQDKDGNRFWYT